MAGCSNKSVLLFEEGRDFLRDVFFFNFEKSSFLMKTMLLKGIHKFSVVYKEYDRNPRRVCRKRSTDWCNHEVLLARARERCLVK